MLRTRIAARSAVGIATLLLALPTLAQVSAERLGRLDDFLAAYVEDGELRWFDPATGKELLNYTEQDEQREEERNGRLVEREGRLAEREGRLAAEARASRAEALADEMRELLKAHGIAWPAP